MQPNQVRYFGFGEFLGHHLLRCFWPPHLQGGPSPIASSSQFNRPRVEHCSGGVPSCGGLMITSVFFAFMFLRSDLQARTGCDVFAPFLAHWFKQTYRKSQFSNRVLLYVGIALGSARNVKFGRSTLFLISTHPLSNLPGSASLLSCGVCKCC